METIEINLTIKKELEKHVEYLNEYFRSDNINNLTIVRPEERKEWFKKLSKENSKHNIYAYYKKTDSVLELFYIGQTDNKYSTQRMHQHLIKASKTTSSKLPELKDIDELGFKSIIIEPQELRHYFEIMLIKQLDPPGNNHSSNKRKK